MIFVIKVCVNIASSPWIGYRGSPSTLDNTTTTNHEFTSWHIRQRWPS